MGRGYVEEIIETPQDELGGASGPKKRFRMQFIGKTNETEYPYTVANEVVGGAIGAAIGLPVAMGIADSVGNSYFYLVQNIQSDNTKQAGPPASTSVFESFVKDNPILIHGAIVFDLFIANNDRAVAPERRNLKLDVGGQLFLYDHGNCCFYRNRPDAGIFAGVDRLNAVEGDLQKMFDMDHKKNVYWELLTDSKLLNHWLERIEQIPDFMIESFIELIPKGMNQPNDKERKELVRFLVKRKGYLRQHIAMDTTHFPNLGEDE